MSSRAYVFEFGKTTLKRIAAAVASILMAISLASGTAWAQEPAPTSASTATNATATTVDATNAIATANAAGTATAATNVTATANATDVTAATNVTATATGTAAEPRLAAGALGAQAGANGTITSGSITVSGLDAFGGLLMDYTFSDRTFTVSIASSHPDDELLVETSNDDVAYIETDSTFDYLEPGQAATGTVICSGMDCGFAMITVELGDDKVTFPVITKADYASPATATKASYHQARLTWNASPNASGYLLQRVRAAEDLIWGADAWEHVGTFQTFMRVSGGATSQALVEAPWNVAYAYRAVPYVTYNGVDYRPENLDEDEGELGFRLPEPAVKLSATKSGAAGTKLTWTAEAGVTGYEVMRSTAESSGYSVIAKTSSETYTDKKAKKGIRYFYQVRATYGKAGKVVSNSCVRFTSAKSHKARAKAIGLDQQTGYGEYWGNWAHPDTTTYYSTGSKLYAACYDNGKLKVYGIGSSLKRTSVKTVKLPAHDV